MLHFTEAEFDARMTRTRAAMAERGLDAMLLFAPESQYWLTGYDTFGFCFFQCLIVSADAPVLLTRSADLRQAQLTSTVRDIRIWKDRAGADPTEDLAAILAELGLTGARIGWETATQGLTHSNGRRVEARIGEMAHLVEASDLMGKLRLVKSAAEIAYVRRAAELGDAAFDAAVAVTRPGANEGDVLAAMHDVIFRGGGDYPANEFIVGSGEHALLCRYQAGRRTFEADDQLNLEWAGTYRHYHAANFKTIVIGTPRPQHVAMHAAARDALMACEAALRPGRPMAEVFDAHARVLDAAGFGAHRLHACGYSLGPRFAPSWMEDQMFYEGAPTIMEPGMVFFLHMILMDSESRTAMCLGRTSLVTDGAAEPLSRMPLDMVVV
ncbi:aminopeptidase P family protein [Limibaculum sp. M0105]|uniref:Aminopeptidase P family protein n=1 Tax=Thermohalobaculum xanthum TaxID=2753746 RepID=A0A8J7SCG3_9RHOB|nr:Xaa-Pro peptidase family protein [Thermohalobaculum xanthum]MBK0399407.1 aminopeptidase P family protein [Thermohalobaculum xanthum]